jgi:hypothetical protein
MTFCHNCLEYKGIFTCEECGTEYCIFCEDACPGCGADLP